MADQKLFNVGVKALIVNAENKILVFDVNTSRINDSTPHADLPGGRIDMGEDLLRALRRELEEETGITTYEPPEFLTAVISPIQITLSIGQKGGLVLFVYKVRIPEGSTIRLSNEHLSYEWLDTADAAERLEFKFTKAFSDLLREGING